MTKPKPQFLSPDWGSLKEQERLVWAAAFVAGEQVGEVGTGVADAMVEKLRAINLSADSAHSPSDDPNGDPSLQRVPEALVREIGTTASAKASSNRALQPVHEALACGVWMSAEEFENWYPVAYRIAMRGSNSSDRPTREEMARAMDAFAMGRSDFY